eukprot:CAMPEP_0113548352 /NCGR_PEP_ID=MMETSP0015_2-20120614/12846_1 /TAXON_ID=2838 /ORGANISM="Odontella" /LENGTH=503 /DNA_ID=CAMNT_0000448973 /DNA_START=113 /DNA_END=1621 /DNA_ORIENTATION=+ /assembly_acc=CAM_ASM_000160
MTKSRSSRGTPLVAGTFALLASLHGRCYNPRASAFSPLASSSARPRSLLNGSSGGRAGAMTGSFSSARTASSSPRGGAARSSSSSSSTRPFPYDYSRAVPRGGGRRGTSLSSSKGSSSSSSNQQQGGGGGGDERLSTKGAIFMALLALQFGIQPALVKAYTPRGVVKSSVVLMQELTKFVISCVLYVGGTSTEQRKVDFSGMTIWTWIAIAGIPAALYNVQNIAALLAYQNLEPLTFNVLNQTKTMSAALCCYLVMGKKQSKMQMVSLCLLLVSALVIEKVLTLGSLSNPPHLLSWLGGLGGMFGAGAAEGGAALARHVTHGVFPILLASFISGLAGAIVQKNLQGSSKSSKSGGKKKKMLPRNPYLFNMELNSASSLLLLLSMLFTDDGKRIAAEGFFAGGWTPRTFVPILTNSVGGIIVALVTKYAGSVRKGFALIFGILISGILQAEMMAVGGGGGSGGSIIEAAQVVGGLLAAASLYLHTMYPYRPKTEKKKDEEGKEK